MLTFVIGRTLLSLLTIPTVDFIHHVLLFAHPVNLTEVWYHSNGAAVSTGIGRLRGLIKNALTSNRMDCRGFMEYKTTDRVASLILTFQILHQKSILHCQGLDLPLTATRNVYRKLLDLKFYREGCGEDSRRKGCFEAIGVIKMSGLGA